MNANSSPDNSSSKRPLLPRWAAWILHLLHLFWPAAVGVLVVVVLGLIFGWNTIRQWSDGFFYAAVAQVMVAGITLMGSPMSRQTVDASTLRYVSGSDVTEGHRDLFLDTLNKQSFGFRTFIGGVLTALIAGLVLLI